jgi:hypothetical protein
LDYRLLEVLRLSGSSVLWIFPALKLAAANFGSRIEILFYLSEFRRGDRRQSLELGVSAAFRLGCSRLSIFEQVAEPILVEQKRFEYALPDARREQNSTFLVDEYRNQCGERRHHPLRAVLRASPLGHREGSWRSGSTRRPSLGREGIHFVRTSI